MSREYQANRDSYKRTEQWPMTEVKRKYISASTIVLNKTI